MALTLTNSTTTTDTDYDNDLSLTKDSTEDEEGNTVYTVDFTTDTESQWNTIYTLVKNYIEANYK